MEAAWAYEETGGNSWKRNKTHGNSSQLGGVELRAALNVVLAVENAWSRTGGFDPVEYWRPVQLTEYNWLGGRTGGVEPVEYWRTVQLTESNWWGGRTGGVEPVE